MYNIEHEIKEYADRIIKLKNCDLGRLNPKIRKEIEGLELNFLVYVKGHNILNNECDAIYFVPYSHKRFKTIIKRLEKKFELYTNIVISEDDLKRGEYHG